MTVALTGASFVTYLAKTDVSAAVWGLHALFVGFAFAIPLAIIHFTSPLRSPRKGVFIGSLLLILAAGIIYTLYLA